MRGLAFDLFRDHLLESIITDFPTEHHMIGVLNFVVEHYGDPRSPIICSISWWVSDTPQVINRRHPSGIDGTFRAVVPSAITTKA